jgi:diaminohydroxyphosphoribosylaminopyrimidine deaminase/5-amino-6-(5-phosphoribosylamino)uracil reductase
VIIQGGRFTLQQFINANLWDEAIVIKNENLKLENGTKAPEFNHTATKIENFRDNTVSFFRLK